MASRAISLLAACHLIVRYAASIHLEPPSRKSSGPEWVDKTISNRVKWIPRAVECEKQQLFRAKWMPRGNNTPAKVEPVAVRDMQTEFSDLSPAEMAWVDEEYARSYINLLNTSSGQAREGRANATHGGADAFPLTTGECKEAYGGYAPDKVLDREHLYTCRLSNVYSIGGALEAHVLEADEFPSGLLRLYTECGSFPKLLKDLVKIKRHASRSAFEAYMEDAAHARYKHYGTTVAFLPKWHFNIGHALYDGLYPAFVALVQWGMDQAPFRVLKLGGRNPNSVDKKCPGAYSRNEQLYGFIGGNGFIALSDSKDDPALCHSLFETLVIGMGRNGQKLDMNSNFSIGGGRDLGAARLFRSHVYKSLDIPARAERPPETRGILIANKRWTVTDWVDPVLSRAADAGVKLELVDWGTLKPGESPSPTHSRFRDQILLVSKQDIHISSPGTAMMYQHFLPDGAVHINLGETPGLPRQFMEEYMAEGAPYIRALYYWPGDGKVEGYGVDRVMDLVLQAKELVQKGFAIPVPVNSNLSPALRVVKVFAYLTQDEGALRQLTPLANLGSKSPAYDMTNLHKAFPHDVLATSLPRDVPTTFNACLLRALTEDYGEPCDKCSWGFP